MMSKFNSYNSLEVTFIKMYNFVSLLTTFTYNSEICLPSGSLYVLQLDVVLTINNHISAFIQTDLQKSHSL